MSDRCKSAGTLVSIGADEIILSDMGELGPLDVQIAKEDELIGSDSGLIPVQALMILRTEVLKAFEHYFVHMVAMGGGSIKTLSAARLAARLTTECFSKIYQKIDPMKLGEFERAINISEAYGARLNRGNLKDMQGLWRLITDYPSHGFVIDRQEASELFHHVRKPSEAEQKFADRLADFQNMRGMEIDGVAVEFFSEGNTISKREAESSEEETHDRTIQQPHEIKTVNADPQGAGIGNAP